MAKTKSCPKCEQQVPVACKACPCGYSFFNAKRARISSLNSVNSGGEDIRRRTQRVRREKPDYYDSLEYDKQHVRRVRTRHSECDEDETKTKGKRKKIKKEEEEEDDLTIYSNMTQEKQEHCAIILAELNRKLQVVTWKPPIA